MKKKDTFKLIAIVTVVLLSALSQNAKAESLNAYIQSIKLVKGVK